MTLTTLTLHAPLPATDELDEVVLIRSGVMGTLLFGEKVAAEANRFSSTIFGPHSLAAYLPTPKREATQIYNLEN